MQLLAAKSQELYPIQWSFRKTLFSLCFQKTVAIRGQKEMVGVS